MLESFAGLWLLTHVAVLLAPGLAAPPVVLALSQLVWLLLAAALRCPALRVELILSAACVSGAINATVQASNALGDRLDASLSGQTLVVEGVIASLPRAGSQSVSFLLEEARVRSQAATELPQRMRVSWFRAARHPAAGEVWRLRLRLRPPAGKVNPGGFDEEAWFFRTRIGATASVVADAANKRVGTAPRRLLRLRAHIAEHVAKALADHPARGLVTGLAVGVRHEIAATQWRTLARTGTGHLVAISGLHVGLVAGLVFLLVRLLWSLVPGPGLRVAPVDAAWLPALAAATGYALLSGLALPARRALVMLFLWFAARALRRRVRAGRIFAVTLIVSLCMDALSVLSPGFWLSFCAVASLILGGGLVGHSGPRWLTSQAHVFVGLAPVMLAAFSGLPLIAPFANLLLIPLFSFLIIPPLLVTLALMLVWPGSAALLHWPGWLIERVWPVLEWAARFDGLFWHAPGRTLPLLLAMALLSLIWFAPRWPGRRSLAALLISAILMSVANQPDAGGARVTVLDVGHGLAVIVRTRSHALVYDSGPARGPGMSAAERQLIPALEHHGVTRPDVIMLSHADAAHIGGAGYLLDRYPFAATITGAPEAVGERTRGAGVTRCRPGLSWNWDGVRFEVLQPGTEILWEDDDSSCVLHISTGERSLLITGDLTERGERRLLERYPRLRADVVIGLGHGSERASSPPLVARMGAGAVIFGTARFNAWELPRASVLRRWSAAGASVLDTGSQGAVEAVLANAGGEWRVRGIRAASPRVWRLPPLR